VLIAAVFALTATPGSASMAVGLRPQHGLHVQEYWRSGTRCYAVQNLRADSVRVDVREKLMVSRKTQLPGGIGVARVPKMAPGDTLATWAFGPGELKIIAAPDVPPDAHFEFLVDGFGVGTCVDRGAPAASSLKSVATFSHLHTPGSTNENAWVEQDSLWFRSGSEFEVELVVTAGAGEIWFRHPEPGGSASQLRVVGASSAMIPTSDWGGVVRIDATATDAPRERRRVTLVVRAPDVESPALLPLYGVVWEKPKSIAWSISRGFLIRP